MRKRFAVLVAASLAIAAIGCSKDVRAPDKAAEGARPSPGQSASEAKSIGERILQEHARTEGKIDTDYIKLNLRPGLTREEVAGLFGTGYKAVIHNEGPGILMWRYDFADTGYQFQPTGKAIGTNLAQPDLNGLARGMVHMQLFVGWDPKSNVTAYSELYYFDDREAKHRVRLYAVQPDGTCSDREIPAL